MTESYLVKLFEHNNWANFKMIQACSTLSEEQLDTAPQSVTKGTIRLTLQHLVAAQHGYLNLLTLPVEERVRIEPATFAELEDLAHTSGEGLLAVARGERNPLSSQLRTRDDFYVDPWVVMVQIINHATEHREQISSMLTALEITPPDLDGWSYGEATKALVPVAE